MTERDTSTEALFQTALHSHGAGELSDAEKLYQRILEREPLHGGALFNLAVIAHQFGHRHVAKDLLVRFVTISPATPEGHFRLGLIHHELAEHEQAQERYQRTLQLQPDHAAARAYLDGVQADLRLAADPDYADESGAPWGAGDSTWKEGLGNGTLFVLFAGLGVGNSRPTFIFRNFLKPYNKIDKLYVRDLSSRWYFGGMSGVSSDVRSTADFLRAELQGYSRTVFIGCSAGAMAAILYGELSGADRVLAFSPQTVLTDTKETELGDYRWARQIETIRNDCRGDGYMDLATLCPLESSIDIHYPADDRLDSEHAQRLHGRHVKLIEHRSNSHVLAMELRDQGELKKIIEREQ